MELGFVTAPVSDKKIDWLFSLDADCFSLGNSLPFFTYFGTHGVDHVNFADIIIPTSFVYEKQGSFLNVLGQRQLAAFAVVPPSKDIRTEWSWVYGFE